MTKTEALRKFYSKNNIDISRSSDPDDGNYDVRLVDFDKQVDLWLRNIETKDHELFLNLLSRYTYLTEVQCQKRYGHIICLLEEELNKLGLHLADVLFVTVESKDGSKSGGDNVRADLHKRNIRKVSKKQILAAKSNLKNDRDDRLKRYKVIVFIDDVVGSGSTSWCEVKNFYKRFLQSIKSNSHKLYYACIAPRKTGLEKFKDNCKSNGIEIDILIDGLWYEEPAFDKDSDDYKQISKYERLIADYMRKKPSKNFFMGFEENRLLLSFHYNTPNNTLCSFWRVTPNNEPPFYRDGDQPKMRPQLDDLKAVKKHANNNSYKFGIERKKREDIEINL